jgi:hypothetical protein
LIVCSTLVTDYHVTVANHSADGHKPPTALYRLFFVDFRSIRLEPQILPFSEPEN